MLIVLIFLLKRFLFITKIKRHKKQHKHDHGSGFCVKKM